MAPPLARAHQTLEDEQQVARVHVGKAGGQSIALAFQRASELIGIPDLLLRAHVTGRIARARRATATRSGPVAPQKIRDQRRPSKAITSRAPTDRSRPGAVASR